MHFLYEIHLRGGYNINDGKITSHTILKNDDA
jgi:hypothetical protein